ncbi:hypothetical protein YC2023_026191 [Brassica napus]
MSTIIRRRRNKVEMLKNDENKWISEARELEELAVSYFKKLYSLEDVETEPHDLPMRGFVRITSQEHTVLNKRFSAEEVEKAIRDMGMITKAMVGRLKGIMNKLIGPAQSSFIPGRLSADNIVIVQEAVHSMRRKKGRKGWMILKLDLEKAYDRLRWDFLENTLRAAGLSADWVGRIMECVAGPEMSILWNELLGRK